MSPKIDMHIMSFANKNVQEKKARDIYLYLYREIYIPIYMYVCVYICACINVYFYT